jgi:hypothetical protein
MISQFQPKREIATLNTVRADPEPVEGSKPCSFLKPKREEQAFDKLRPDGVGEHTAQIGFKA